MSNYCNNYDSEIDVKTLQNIPVPANPINTTQTIISSMFLKHIWYTNFTNIH